MHLKTLLLLTLLISIHALKAQTDFRPGYIIKLSGDTIMGKIDYRGDLTMGHSCKFKLAENEINEYTPNDILAYRFIDSKYFISKEIKGEKVFLEFLIKAKVNIYYMRDEKGEHYFIDAEGDQITEIPFLSEIRYKNDMPYIFESTWHIGILAYYMRDAPDFQLRIAKMVKPEHQNLIKLAEDYHHKVCKDEKCIIYEKHRPYIKINVEILGGAVNLKDNDLIDKSYFQKGVLLHFWMPKVNEKIYFKTGILFTRLEEKEGDKYNHIITPVHIGYMAPNTFRIRPYASIGLLSPSYSAGVQIKAGKRINLGIQSWVNFIGHDNMYLIPVSLSDYSLLASIYIEL